MRIRHDQAVLADHRFFPVGRASVHRYKFPDGGIIANDNGGIFPMKFQILWNGSNDCTREDAAIFANSGAFHNGYVGADPGAITYFDILVNNGKWINFYIGCQPGIRMYVCMRMNHVVCCKTGKVNR